MCQAHFLDPCLINTTTKSIWTVYKREHEAFFQDTAAAKSDPVPVTVGSRGTLLPCSPRHSSAVRCATRSTVDDIIYERLWGSHIHLPCCALLEKTKTFSALLCWLRAALFFVVPQARVFGLQDRPSSSVNIENSSHHQVLTLPKLRYAYQRAPYHALARSQSVALEPCFARNRATGQELHLLMLISESNIMFWSTHWS